MKIFYTHKVAKQLENLSYSVQKRIVEKMRFYANQKDISFILEVPGFSGNGPDEENVKILNSLKD